MFTALHNMQHVLYVREFGFISCSSQMLD